MNIKDLNTLEQLEQFLTSSQAVAFLVASSTDECYQGIQQYLDTGKMNGSSGLIRALSASIPLKITLAGLAR